MMSKYLETKEKYPDCILMYRLGDFYEMFFDDALEASKILDITLTGKNAVWAMSVRLCVAFRIMLLMLTYQNS